MNAWLHDSIDDVEVSLRRNEDIELQSKLVKRWLKFVRMKTISLTVLLLVSHSFFAQEVDENLLLKHWYYCDHAISPYEAEKMLFAADETIACSSSDLTFYWRFHPDKSISWSDVIHHIEITISDGVLTETSANEWKLENQTLWIGNRQYAIDVLDEKNLLIHRIEE